MDTNGKIFNSNNLVYNQLRFPYSGLFPKYESQSSLAHSISLLSNLIIHGLYARYSSFSNCRIYDRKIFLLIWFLSSSYLSFRVTIFIQWNPLNLIHFWTCLSIFYSVCSWISTVPWNFHPMQTHTKYGIVIPRLKPIIGTPDAPIKWNWFNLLKALAWPVSMSIRLQEYAPKPKTWVDKEQYYIFSFLSTNSFTCILI